MSATATATMTATIREALDVLLQPGTVAELRILNRRQGTVSGYFDNPISYWWRGKSPRSGAWPLFRAKSGIWIAKHQLDQTPQEDHCDILRGIPGLLDWYLKDRES